MSTLDLGALAAPVVISLRRRPDRLAAFTGRWRAATGGRRVGVFEAVDTGSAAGCLASHLAVCDLHPAPVMIYEDDACFHPDFTLHVPAPPPDWHVLWLGGQHTTPPTPASAPGWVRAGRLLRTHAYVARFPVLFATMARAANVLRADPFLAGLPVPQYVLDPQTVGQAAGRSDIDGRDRDRDEYWRRR